MEARYIAVADYYDSNNHQHGLNFESKFKNLINGVLPLQVSYSQKQVKMEEALQGKHNGPVPLYGYRYNEDREYEVDWEAAYVVQTIMDLLDHKKKYSEIISILASKKIEPPSAYLSNKYGVKLSKISRSGVWNRTTILKMARNKAYLGYSVRHKISTCVSGTKKSKAVERENYVLVPNRQPAIVGEAQFYRVNDWIDQKCEKANGKKRKNYRISALFKKVYCKRCGCAMTRKKYSDRNDSYICTEKKSNPLSTCVSEKINTEDLEKAVFLAIQHNIRLLIEDKKKVREYMKNRIDMPEDVEELRGQVATLGNQKMDIYLEFKSGLLSKETYMLKKEGISCKIDGLERKIACIQNEMKKKEESTSIFNSEYTQLAKKFQQEAILTFEMVDAFIEKVLIDAEKEIEIIFKFEDELWNLK